jgi:DinB superfamily
MSLMNQDTELLEQLQATPGTLQRLYASPDGAALHWYGETDGEVWSIAATAGHLASVDREVWQLRLLRLLEAFATSGEAGHENPHLQSWSHRGYEAYTNEALLAKFRHERLRTLTLLRQFNPAIWQKSAHSQWGTISAAEVAQRILEHDREHLAQIDARLSSAHS